MADMIRKSNPELFFEILKDPDRKVTSQDDL